MSALATLINQWEAHSGCYVDPALRDHTAHGSRLAAERWLRSWLSSRSPVLLIVGPPGAGKSTLLYRLAATLAHEHLAAQREPGQAAPLPVYLKGRAPGPDEARQPCVLILDDAPTADLLSSFEQRKGQHFKAVLCCQQGDPVVDTAVLQGWEVAHLEAFDEEQVRSYLELRLPDPARRGIALAALLRNESLRLLCRRPGLLALLGGGLGPALPSLMDLHALLPAGWLEGILDQDTQPAEPRLRDALARVLARKRAREGSVPLWDLLPEAALELPGELDGPSCLVGLLRARGDALFVVEQSAKGDKALRFASEEGADHFLGEDMAARLHLASVAHIAACVQRGHSQRPRAISLSSHGRLCASGDDEGRVLLWDVETGHLLRDLSGHGDPVSALLFAEGDAFIVSASLDFTVRVWESKTGRPLRSLVGHSDGVTALSYAPTTQLLASGSLDGSVRIWQLPEGRSRKVVHAQAGGITGIALSQGGALCVAGTAEPVVHVFHALSGARLLVLGGHSGIIRSVAVSPDGHLCASAGDDRAIRLTDLRTGELLQSIHAHQQEVHTLAFSRDGRMLASGGADNTVRVFALPVAGEHTPARLLHCFTGHEGAVRCLALSGDRLLATVSEDGPPCLWDVRQRLLLRSLQGALRGAWLQARCLSLSPDGSLLAGGSSDGAVRVWQCQEGRLLRDLRGHEGAVLSVAFSPTGERLASGSDDQSMCLWDAHGELVDRFEGHFSDVTALAFSPDGRLLASGAEDATIRVRDTSTGDLQATLAVGEAVTDLRFCPDGEHLVVAGARGMARMFSRSGGARASAVASHLGGISSLDLSPDGRLLLTGGEDHRVRVWELATGDCIHSLDGHLSAVTALACSPDGHTVASASRDRTVRLWHAAEGRALLVLRHGGTITALRFSSDGARLLCAGPDGIVVWHAREARVLGQMIATGEGWLTLAPVASQEAAPRYLLYAAQPGLPDALRVSDLLASYPIRGFAKLCQRSQLVSRTLSGQAEKDISSLREEIRGNILPPR